MSEVVSAWALETYSRAVGAARNGVNPQYSDERAALVIETALAAKLAEREAEVPKRVMDALWPVLGGSHTDAETWQEISDAIAAAIRATKDNT